MHFLFGLFTETTVFEERASRRWGDGAGRGGKPGAQYFDQEVVMADQEKSVMFRQIEREPGILFGLPRNLQAVRRWYVLR